LHTIQLANAQLFLKFITDEKKKSNNPRPLSPVPPDFLGFAPHRPVAQARPQVIGIDNFVTGSVANINHLAGNRDFRFIQQDVTSSFSRRPRRLRLALRLACQPRLIICKFPIQTLKVSSLGTHKALGLAKEKSARFLIASTSEIYGDPLVHPQPEEYWGNVNTIGPRGCYDEAKRFAEAMTMAYHASTRSRRASSASSTPTARA